MFDVQQPVAEAGAGRWLSRLAVAVSLSCGLSAHASSDWTTLTASSYVTPPTAGEAEPALRMWLDRLQTGQAQWNAAGRTGSLPIRASWTVVRGPSGPIEVGMLATLYDCSVSGSYSKADLFTWCQLRIRTGSGVQDISACWIDAYPGSDLDPATHHVRMRLVGTRLQFQTIQAGRVIPRCSLDIPVH